MVKSKMPARSGSVALRQLNPIHKKGSKDFFYYWIGVTKLKQRSERGLNLADTSVILNFFEKETLNTIIQNWLLH